MNRILNRILALVGLGAVGSQAGHLLVYQLQYGSSALAVQSHGVHAYFPVLAKTSLGVTAGMFLGALLLVGVSRLLAVRPGTKMTPGPSYFSLLAALFTIQLTCFVLQETIESVVAGAAVASAPHLILLGSLGQLPVAAIAALALKWLSVRFEAALTTLRQAITPEVWAHETVLLLLAHRAPSAQLALVDTCPTAFAKRGPPQILRS
ncbi:MAG TPA: hypothetical protein VNU19_06815 [Candidatus Acidoferrum sp.]|nr:hypothetical protein [Candidatus Acidoferrum sp.]